MTFFYITYYCFEWFIHQCFFIHISHVFLLLQTSHEHENHINRWNINDVIKEHSSIFFVYLVVYEHRLIFFYHYWFIQDIDHFMCKRYFIHETFEIVNKRIITIKIVYHAFSKRIVECFFSRHTRIFWCFQICHINKFYIRRIIIYVFVVINSFVIFFVFFVLFVLFIIFAVLCNDFIQNIRVNNAIDDLKNWWIFFARISYHFFFKAFFFIQKILHSWLYVSIFWIHAFYYKRIV
jgi:hypothetical protein